MNDEGGPEELRREVEEGIREAARRPNIRADTAEARVNIDPSAIPGSSADYQQVLTAINSEFHSQFDLSAISKYVPPEHRGNLDPVTAIQLAVENYDDEPVVFRGGWLTLGDNVEQVTPIQRFGFASQNLAATVSGTSDEALYLCKRLALVLWQAAGIQRKWTELDDLVAIIAYRTSTIVDLGFPLSRLLAPAFMEFVQQDIAGSQGFGGRMGIFDSRKKEFAPDVVITPYCREIELQIVVSDPTSGESDECILDILMHSRADANRSRVKILSELDSRSHADMISRLITRIKSKG